MNKFGSLLKRIALFEKMAVYGNRISVLRSIAQEETKYPTSGNVIPMSYDPKLPMTESNSVAITTPPPPTPPTPPAPTTQYKAYPSIPKEDQDNVEWFTMTNPVPGSKGFLGNEKSGADGILGPKTRGSIDAVKKYLNMQHATDKQIFDYLFLLRTAKMQQEKELKSGESSKEDFFGELARQGKLPTSDSERMTALQRITKDISKSEYNPPVPTY